MIGSWRFVNIIRINWNMTLISLPWATQFQSCFIPHSFFSKCPVPFLHHLWGHRHGCLWPQRWCRKQTYSIFCLISTIKESQQRLRWIRSLQSCLMTYYWWRCQDLGLVRKDIRSWQFSSTVAFMPVKNTAYLESLETALRTWRVNNAYMDFIKTHFIFGVKKYYVLA